MALIDQTAKAVYSRFNNSQLRELALAAKVSSERVARMTSSAQAVEAVDAVTDRTRLALLAHRIEAISPYKHCVLLEAIKPFSYLQVGKKMRENFLSLFEGFSPLDSATRELHPELCVDDPDAERLFVKFAHMVEVYEFRKTQDGLLRTPAWRRHIVVAEINAQSQLVSVNFPGFSQPVATGTDRITYGKFANQVVAFLIEHLALELEPFKAKPVTDFLLEDSKSEVVDLKRTLRFQRGGKMDLDSESDQDAATSLAQGLVASGIKVSPEAIRLAFRASEAQAIVLLWKRTGLITRFSLRDSLPEILFVWNDAEPSLALIDDTLRALSNARVLVGSPRLKEAQKALSEMSRGNIVRPVWLEQNFALSASQALKILLDEASNKRFSPVFRIRPDRVVSQASWVDSLVDLPKHATDLEGDIVSPIDPTNIEVGFKKAVE